MLQTKKNYQFKKGILYREQHNITIEHSISSRQHSTKKPY